MQFLYILYNTFKYYFAHYIVKMKYFHYSSNCYLTHWHHPYKDIRPVSLRLQTLWTAGYSTACHVTRHRAHFRPGTRPRRARIFLISFWERKRIRCLGNGKNICMLIFLWRIWLSCDCVDVTKCDVLLKKLRLNSLNGHFSKCPCYHINIAESQEAKQTKIVYLSKQFQYHRKPTLKMYHDVHLKR